MKKPRAKVKPVFKTCLHCGKLLYSKFEAKRHLCPVIYSGANRVDDKGYY
jgi:hypothetical protein